MTLRYALVAANGECAHIITPGIPDLYQDRTIVDGFLVVHIESDEPDYVFIEERYWDRGRWKTRTRAPSRFYYWNEGKWNFDADRFYSEVRSIRDARLLACDWTQMPDVALSESKKGLWKLYRQDLRDMPRSVAGIDCIDKVIWPKPPES